MSRTRNQKSAPGFSIIPERFITSGRDEDNNMLAGNLAALKGCAGEMAVLILLNHFTNREEGNPRYGMCWLSITTMATLSGMAHQNVSRSIKKLVKRGFAERVKIDGKYGKSTHYRACLEGAPAHMARCASVVRTEERTEEEETRPKKPSYFDVRAGVIKPWRRAKKQPPKTNVIAIGVVEDARKNGGATDFQN